MIYLLMECKSDLPKVKYFTALDIYLVVCFIFIVSSLLEYGIVHLQIEQLDEQDTLTVYRYLSLNRRGIRNFKKSLRDIEKDAGLRSSNLNFKLNKEFQVKLKKGKNIYLDDKFKVLKLLDKKNLRAIALSFLKSEPKYENYDRISKIDLYSRIFYPILFALFNFFYWKFYLDIN